ncbi:heterokaryon incompatibility protein-domain-containing protein [Xylariaceae sp. FL0255]|nr:heterokaryon incompatibility protein-domain-containing protein [Xylariaceae sp. FL0255]
MNPATGSNLSGDVHSKLYSSLPFPDPRQFVRLLMLKSIAPDRIDIDLKVFNLQELRAGHVSFSTMSYTWSDPDVKGNTISRLFHVYANGQQIPVQKNLFSALTHMVNLIQGKWIWIDAVSINQRNELEKGLQIPLMRDLYSNAKTNYIWLGKGDRNTEEAMDYLQSIGRDGPNLRWSYARQLLSRIFLFRSSPHFVGLQKIFGYSWISRLWTLQEAILPKNSVIVCGWKSIDWATMALSMEFINYARTRALSLNFPAACRDWHRLFQMFKNRRVGRTTSHCDEHGLENNATFFVKREHHKKSMDRGWYIVKIVTVLLYFIPSAITIVGFVLVSRFTLIIAPLGIGVGILFFLAFSSRSFSYVGRKHKEFRSTIPWAVKDSTIIEFSVRSASRPKDRYNGILGLLAESPTLPDQQDRPKSLGSVYQALSIDLIKTLGSAHILFFSGRTEPAHSPSCPKRQILRVENQSLEQCLSCNQLEYCNSMACTDRHPCRFCHQRKRCENCESGNDCEDCIALANCPLCTGLEGFPSWVVDWRTSRINWMTSLFFVTRGIRWWHRLQLWRPLRLMRYRGATSIDTPVKLKVVEDHKVLRLGDSRVIGTISSVSSRLSDIQQISNNQNTAHDADLAEEVLKSLTQKCCRTKEPEDPSPEKRKEQLELIRSARAGHLEGLERLARFFEICANESRSSSEAKRWAQALCGLLADDEAVTKLRKKRGVWSYHLEFAKFLGREDMRLFTCLDNPGVAPSGVQEGDELVLIRGITLPMVLRATSKANRYTVVGPSFFPSAMYLQHWKEDGLKTIYLE